MGWFVVVGPLGLMGAGLLGYAEFFCKRVVRDGLWMVYLLGVALLVLAGVAALRITSPEGGLGPDRLLSPVTVVLIWVIGMACLVLRALRLTKEGVDAERREYAWLAVWAWCISALLFALLFTAQEEAYGGLIAGGAFFLVFAILLAIVGRFL